MRVRSYGSEGPWVVLVHGGPGAPGHMAPVARGLADAFRVLEPFQRGAGDEPLTVARHVADLLELTESRCGRARPALVGSSWGAMLALAFAAAHPSRAGPLVLVGCGTFDPIARARLKTTIEKRMNDDLRRRLERATFAEMGDLLLPLYAYDPITNVEGAPPDERAHEETWSDMVRLQQEGAYPAAFAAIESPVLMLHGAFDPHPGPLIRESLAPHVRNLEYVEWERCGHYPWIERAVSDEFFAALRRWLSAAPTG